MSRQSLILCILACGVISAGQVQQSTRPVKPVIMVFFAAPEDDQRELLRLVGQADFTEKAKRLGYELVERESVAWLLPVDFAGAKTKQEFAALCSSLEILVKVNGSNLSAKSIEPAQRRAFSLQMAMIGKHLRPEVAVSIMSDEVKFGFDVDQIVVLTDGDKRITVRASEWMSRDMRHHRNKWSEQLNQEDDVRYKREQLLADVGTVSQSLLRNVQFEFNSYPLKPRARARLLRELAEFIEEELATADESAIRAEKALIDALLPLGKSKFKDSVPKGLEFNKLDLAFKDLIQTELVTNAEMYGFIDAADVVAFLGRANVANSGRDLYIVFSWEHADGKIGQFSFPFGSLLGY